MRISPESMLSSPASARSVVVFPQPEGPSSTTNSPCRICRLSLRMTWFAPKCFSASMIWMSAMSVAFGRTGRGFWLDARKHIEGQQAEDDQQDAVAVQRLDPRLAQRDDAEHHQRHAGGLELTGVPGQHGWLLSDRTEGHAAQ